MEAFRQPPALVQYGGEEDACGGSQTDRQPHRRVGFPRRRCRRDLLIEAQRWLLIEHDVTALRRGDSLGRLMPGVQLQLRFRGRGSRLGLEIPNDGLRFAMRIHGNLAQWAGQYLGHCWHQRELADEFSLRLGILLRCKLVDLFDRRLGHHWMR